MVANSGGGQAPSAFPRCTLDTAHILDRADEAPALVCCWGVRKRNLLAPNLHSALDTFAHAQNTLCVQRLGRFDCQRNEAQHAKREADHEAKLQIRTRPGLVVDPAIGN